jgi:hypothetical protein
METINGGVRVEFWKDIVLHGFPLNRGQLDIYHALFGAVGGKAHNSRALALAKLARRTAHIIALGCWAYDHGAASWRGGVLGLCAGQHHHHRTGRMVRQHVGVI